MPSPPRSNLFSFKKFHAVLGGNSQNRTLATTPLGLENNQGFFCVEIENM